MYTTVIKPINPRHNQPLTQILYLFISRSGCSGSASPIPPDNSFVSHSSNHFLMNYRFPQNVPSSSCPIAEFVGRESIIYKRGRAPAGVTKTPRAIFIYTIINVEFCVFSLFSFFFLFFFNGARRTTNIVLIPRLETTKGEKRICRCERLPLFYLPATQMIRYS